MKPKRKPKRAVKRPRYSRNQAQAAVVLGISVRHLRNVLKLPGAPRADAAGLLDNAELLAFWREVQAEAGRAVDLDAGADVDEDMRTLRARKLLADIRDREMITAVRAGKYLLAAEVRAVQIGRASKLAALLRSALENEMPPLLAGKPAIEIRAALSGVVDRIIGGMAE